MTIKAIVQKIEGMVEGVEHHIVAWVEGDVVKIKQVATTDLEGEWASVQAEAKALTDKYHALVSKFEALSTLLGKNTPTA